MIQPATKNDVAALLSIYAPYIQTTTYTFEYEVPTLEQFTDRFLSITAEYPWLLWEENGQILGYAYGSRAFERTAYSWDADMSIYLAPEAKGRGIGKALYLAVEEILYRQGYHVLYGLVTNTNPASCAFHKALGYREFARHEKTGFKFGQWLDLIWFEKRLRTGDPTGFPVPWPQLDGKECMA